MSLGVVVALPQGAPSGFTDDGERLRQQVVYGFPSGKPFPELVRLAPQLGVAEFWTEASRPFIFPEVGRIFLTAFSLVSPRILLIMETISAPP